LKPTFYLQIPQTRLPPARNTLKPEAGGLHGFNPEINAIRHQSMVILGLPGSLSKLFHGF